jgi:hypothetical protein
MNVWLLKTEDVSLTSIEKTEELLCAYDGPLVFKFQKALISNEIIKKGVIDLKNVLLRLAEFRKENKINSEDFVCLYTNTPLENNYFTHGDENRNFVIHSGDWDLYTSAGHAYPDAYLLYSNILKSFVYKDYDDMFKNLHKDDTLGCYMDLCANKSEILIKLRTADVCETCLEQIRKKHIDGRIIGQIFDAFEGLRKQLLFRNRLQLETKISRLEINAKGKFVLTDYGNIELRFSPIRKAIYKLFMDSKDGYTIADLFGLGKKILELYQSFQPNKTPTELKSTVDVICDPHSMRIHEEISKINAEIVKQLGERVSVNYVISGERGEKRKINYKEIN